MSSQEPPRKDKETAPDLSGMLGMGNFLDGVSNLINKFGDLAQRGEELRKSMGETENNSKPVRTSGGFTVRFGGMQGEAGQPTAVRPVNTGGPKAAGSRPSDKASTVPKEREANVELFEEEDHLLLLAEMPGVASDDVHLDFDNQTLMIQGQSKTALFKAKVELPKAYTSDQVAITANNGVVEIRFEG